MSFERIPILQNGEDITIRHVLDDDWNLAFLSFLPCFFHGHVPCLAGGVPILIKPTTLSRDNTLKTALRVLQAKAIAVGGSWFVDADVVLIVDERDVQRAAAALTEAGFVVIVQKGR